MDYISTSALAKEIDIKSSDLFDKLKTIGWIERVNDKWVLTELGKQKVAKQETILSMVNISYGQKTFQ